MSASVKKPLASIDWHKDLVAIALLIILSLAMSVSFYSPYLYEWDSVQFASALDHFDVASHQPHPPGYPVYIFVGKVFNLVFTDRAMALNVESIVFGALSIVFTYLLAREMFNSKAGFIAASLLALAPMHILSSNVAMSDIVSAGFMAISIYLLYAGLKKDVYFLAGAVASGLVIGVRPQHVFFIFALLVIFNYWKKDMRLAISSTILFGVGILVWLAPLLVLTGGPASYYNILVSEITGLVRLGFSPEQFKSLLRRLLDGWTPMVIVFSSIAVIETLMLIKERKASGQWSVDGRPIILLAVWIILAIINILAFENLYTVRYILPVFAPISIIFSCGILGLGSRMPDKRANLAYYSTIAISVLVMAAFSFLLVGGIQAYPPAPVQAVQYIDEHYTPNDTLILADQSYRHFQYYLPGYSITYTSINYNGLLSVDAPMIVSESPMALDNSTPIAVFRKDDILNYKHLKVGLYEVSIMDSLFINGGVYPVEFLDGAQIRWTTRNASIIYNASSARNLEVLFEAVSYNEPGIMEVYLNGELAHVQRIPGNLQSDFMDVIIPLSLNKGENTILIHSVEEPQKPRDYSIFNLGDTRELCFALRNVTVSEG